MPLSRKIFCIANIIEAILIVFLIGTGMYINPLPYNTFQEILVLLFIVAIPLIVILNCISNLSFARSSEEKFLVTALKAVVFWSLCILFFLVLLLIGGIIYLQYDAYKKISAAGVSKLPAIITIAFLLIMLINGIYILFSQIVLFRQVKKNYKKSNLEFVEAIGMNE